MERLFTVHILSGQKDREMAGQLRIGLRGAKVLYNTKVTGTDIDQQSLSFDRIVRADCIVILTTSKDSFAGNLAHVMEMVEAALSQSEGNMLLLQVINDGEPVRVIAGAKTVFENGSGPETLIREIADTIDKFRNVREGRMGESPAPESDPEEEMTGTGEEPGKDAEEPEADSLDGKAGESGTRNCWLLRMNPETWRIDSMKAGDDAYLTTYYPLGNKRREYDLFGNVRNGDRVLGFAADNYQSIVCELEVDEPVGPSNAYGERFMMKVKRMIDPPVPLSGFRDKIGLLAAAMEDTTRPLQLFFEMSEEQYDMILRASADESETQDEPSLRFFQPFFASEGNHHATDDQLDFENDYNSFATVIALKRVQPPLAIGLFGHWGSGKSFFMEKLAARIEKLSVSGDPDYVRHVVPVRFNSWHYSDANLWASLITHIFESLNDYAKKKEFGADAIKTIYKDLNITSYQLSEVQKKLSANETAARVLDEQKKNVEDSIEQKKETLQVWKTQDFAKVVFSDPFIREDFQRIRDQYREEALITDIREINERLAEVDSFKGQLSASFRLLRENRKGRWRWIWLLGGLAVLGSWLALGPLREYIQQFVQGGYVAASLVVAWLTNLAVWLSPYMDKVSGFYKRLKSLKETIETAKESVRLKEHDEVERLQKEIARLEAERQGLEQQQEQAGRRKEILEEQLADIGSGRLLAGFLESRSADDAYIKQLGIVSWIRRDFSKLNELFLNQQVVSEIGDHKTPAVQIDRIVLYIDDLDRCNEDVVVKVLEAIHLLLAFPLFVVVVGVDPRWLNNALSEKYKSLFGKRSVSVGDTDIVQQEAGYPVLQDGAATSYDYLEKIFQIPFVLKPLNRTGREKLIQYLLRTEMAGSDEVLKKDSTEDDNRKITDPGTIAERPTGARTVPDAGTETYSAIVGLQDQSKDTGGVEIQPGNVKSIGEKLVFSGEELAYMQKISALYGQTPRTINRYVNIYRIIRAHGSFRISDNGYAGREFMPVLFVLGVVVRHTAFAEQFIRSIAEAGDELLFRDFLNAMATDRGFVNLLKSMAADIEEMPMAYFKQNLELISRFSFRTLIG